ncbi:polysaccharide deacetylase family protein [Microbacteriaceae bacterium 4G12]
MANRSLLICFLCTLVSFTFFLSNTTANTLVHVHQQRSSVLSPKTILQQQSCLTQDCIASQQTNGRKIVYLTFDDGPNPYTPQILNILQEKNTKGTFFVIGARVTRYPQVVKRMVQEGHYLGLHSMSHDAKRLYTGNPSPLVYEMEQARKLVLATSGLNTQLIRVPYGSMPYLKQNYRDALVNAKFKMWDWTIDTYDWKRTNTPASVLQAVVRQANKPVEVILMHDSYKTIQVLPKLIDYLRSQGYSLLPYNPNSHVEVNFWHDSRL